MLKNYFLISLRNFWKNKTTGIINVLGLSAGMTCCLLIMIYIQDELSYNRFNSYYKEIACLNWSAVMDGRMRTMATTPLPFAQAMLKELPQVKYAARMYPRSGSMAVPQDPGIHFQEQNVFFSDNDLFRIFSISFLRGNPVNALAAPGTVVITDQMASKYFGKQNPLGKTLWYDNKILLQVTGVVRRMPANSDLQFDFLVPMETLFSVESKAMADFLRVDWNFNPAYTFCLLSEGQQKASIDRLLNAVLKKYGDARRKQLFTVSLEPLKDVHLYAASVLSNLSPSSILYIWIFSAIALLILFIACVNFINLSTARSITRAKEVSMRKVMGATKSQLLFQFLGEHLMAAVFGFVLALAFTWLAIPVLNRLSGKQLSPLACFSLENIIAFLALFLITGILAGLYPAFFISRFNPAASLKGRSGDRLAKGWLRKTLFVAQFTISVILIISAMVIYRQLQYLRNKPLGFKKDYMINVPIFGSGASSMDYSVDLAMRGRMNTFTNELLKYNKIQAATAASGLPGQGFVRGLVIPEGFADKDNLFFPWISVDYTFLSTFKIPLLAGRDFSKATGTDHLSAFILNESAVNKLGWKSPKDAIGKTMIRGNEIDGKKGFVIGVIKDFNFNTLDQPMQPLILDVNVPRFTNFAISIDADHIPGTIGYIRKEWSAIFPERSFEYSFLDRDINALYNDKENLSRMLGYFAIIAIGLSCLGLFSLTSFLCSQRTREIGIRKVLGATIAGIVSLLSQDFIKLALLSLIIGSPAAWIIMHKWLDNYAYRTDMPGWIFLVAGVIILLMTACTVIVQSLSAALSDPVRSLRTE